MVPPPMIPPPMIPPPMVSNPMIPSTLTTNIPFEQHTNTAKVSQDPVNANIVGNETTTVSPSNQMPLFSTGLQTSLTTNILQETNLKTNLAQTNIPLGNATVESQTNNNQTTTTEGATSNVPISGPTDVAQIPMYSPNQFTNVAPTPLENVDPAHPHHLSYVPMNPYPFEPHEHPIASHKAAAENQTPAFYNPAMLSYPASSFPSQTPMQTYSTYPQVQGTSMTTPISLPGMPPITVSTTLPPQALEGLQFNTTTNANNNNNNSNLVSQSN